MADGKVELIAVSSEDDGQRLDRWFKKYYPDLQFGDLHKIMRTGQVRVDGKRVKGSTRLEVGQKVRIPPQVEVYTPEAPKELSEKDIEYIRQMVIYADEDIIALNKPSGLATQGGTKIKKHVDGLLDGLRDERGIRPHLVHRLDKDTSGILLLARHTKAARELGYMFKGREIRKYYWGITAPAPKMHEGKIQSHLAKKSGPNGERMMAVKDGSGKFALTYYTVMEHAGQQLGWVAFWPHTGRTHQIRVHAAQMDCPLLGDRKYGGLESMDEIPDLEPCLHLHARRIIMPHPITGEKLDITAPLSPAMTKTFKYFNFNIHDKSDPFENVHS